MLLWTSLAILILHTYAFTVPGEYELRVRVDSVENVPVPRSDPNPQIFVEYYDLDCIAIRGFESNLVSGSNVTSMSADWSSERLRFLDKLTSVSTISCIKFNIYNKHSMTGQYEVIQRVSIDEKLWPNYFQSIGSTEQWVYEAEGFGGQKTYVYYSTQVSYSVDLDNLYDSTSSNTKKVAAGAFFGTTFGISLMLSIGDYLLNKRKESNPPSRIAAIIFRSTFWMFCGGLWTAILYVLIGVVLMVSLVGIPFGLKLIQLSVMILLPFDRDMVDDEQSEGKLRLSFAVNLVWILIGGAVLSIMHLVCAIILTATILGIPFAMEQMKLARVALMPFGKKVIKIEAKKHLEKQITPKAEAAVKESIPHINSDHESEIGADLPKKTY